MKRNRFVISGGPTKLVKLNRLLRAPWRSPCPLADTWPNKMVFKVDKVGKVFKVDEIVGFGKVVEG